MSIFLLQFLPDLYKSRFCLIKPVCSLLNTDKIMKFLCQTPNLIIDNLYVAVDCPYIGIQCLKIIVDRSKIVFNVPENEEGPSMGGAMLAAVGCGAYPDVETICKKMVKVVDTVEPDPELVAKYEEKYQKFRKLYPTMKELF